MWVIPTDIWVPETTFHIPQRHAACISVLCSSRKTEREPHSQIKGKLYGCRGKPWDWTPNGLPQVRDATKFCICLYLLCFVKNQVAYVFGVFARYLPVCFSTIPLLQLGLGVTPCQTEQTNDTPKNLGSTPTHKPSHGEALAAQPNITPFLLYPILAEPNEDILGLGYISSAMSQGSLIGHSSCASTSNPWWAKWWHAWTRG